jgi:YggT family protein
VFHILAYLIQLYLLVLVARALLSWFQAAPGSALARVDAVLAAITEPVLAPVRKVIKPVPVGGTYLDLSIIVVFLVAELVVIPLLLR